jgi:Raf kinase inhibitor-like YbhB/YbcL family protein
MVQVVPAQQGWLAQQGSNEANQHGSNTAHPDSKVCGGRSMAGNDFFWRLPERPWFTVTSADVADGQPMADAQMSGAFGVPGGQDVSPQLSWSGAPEETRGYAVTIWDPDAPTGSGFWHWAVADIPGDVTELPSGAGDEGGSLLPSGAFQLRNDAGAARFIGAAPPAGHGSHRYVIVVHALDVPQIGVGADATPAFLGFNITSHVLARAVITPTAEIPAS